MVGRHEHLDTARCAGLTPDQACALQVRIIWPSTRKLRVNVPYRVDLSQSERHELEALLCGGKQAARKLKRAQILLAANAGGADEEIAATVSVGGSTVYRTKRRFVERTWNGH